MKRIFKTVIFMALAVFTLTSCGSMRKTTTADPKKPQPVYTGPKKDVDAVNGTLILHPLKVEIETKETTYSCFLDARAKCIFITDDVEAYEEFSEYLPAEKIPDRVIELEGAVIDPFVIFTPEEFADLESKMAKLGVKLNEYKIARLFSYGLSTIQNVPTRTKTTTTGTKKTSLKRTPEKL